jgi:uncharacterized membrane protein YeaQ/YmgE (transglycosylase-associated protein family)
MILDIVLWIIFGALAGWIAFIGGFIVRLLTGNSPDGFSITSLIVAIIGAVILLAIVKAATGRRVGA